MDVGQVKTGDDKDDTYVKMLQEIVRVTAPIAYGIAAQYPTVVDLVQGFRSKGPTALEDLKVCALSCTSSLATWMWYADKFGYGRNVRTRMARCRMRGSGPHSVRGYLRFLWGWIRVRMMFDGLLLVQLYLCWRDVDKPTLYFAGCIGLPPCSSCFPSVNPNISIAFPLL